ncbi:hypothetical protein BDQ17DRAFT_1435637 [Cyathus striatus]|nr:hypothetical protein BDQ17DRAFT_1435637 [Cyathus striatus]
MPSNSHASSSSAANSLAYHIQEVHNRLVNSSTYLGDKDFWTNVKWHKFGCCFKVTELNDSLSSNAEDSTHEVSTPNNDNTSTNHNNLSKSDTVVNSSELEPEIAGITAIVKISDKEFYFTADAGYNEERKANNQIPFSKLALSLTGRAPCIELFKLKFSKKIDNINWFLSLVKHSLFEREPEEATLKEDPKDWSHMRNWPYTNDAARTAASTLYSSHCIRKPAAYDVHRVLIHPNDYRSLLVNATIELDFELTFWPFEADKNGKRPARDVFSADLVAIRTIVAPPRGNQCGTATFPSAMENLWTSRPDTCKQLYLNFAESLSIISDRLEHLGNKAFRSHINWSLVDGEHTAVLTDPEWTPSGFRPYVANLTAAVKITEQDFLFSAEGSLQGTKSIVDPALMTLSLSGTAPTIEPFASHYEDVIHNIKWLQAQVTSNKLIGKSGFLIGPPDKPRLNASHKLLQPVPLYDANLTPANRLDWSTINSWPVYNSFVTESLSLLSNTHQIICPPAYDMHGYLIQPNFYRNHAGN